MILPKGFFFVRSIQHRLLTGVFSVLGGRSRPGRKESTKDEKQSLWLLLSRRRFP